MIITMAQILVIIRRKLTSTKALIFLIVCVICMMIPLGSYLHDIQDLSIRVRGMDRKDLMNRWHGASVEEFLSHRAIYDNLENLVEVYGENVGGLTNSPISSALSSPSTSLSCNSMTLCLDIPPASNLGGILFDRKEIPKPNPNANRKFVVLVWKYWNWLKKRHVYNFGEPGYEEKENKLLEDCSVKNCIFSGNESLIDTADAVVVHLQRGVVPKVKHRNRKQRWIFLNDESPQNAFSLAKKKPSLDSLYNVFNWSMTYRIDADVPVPYGRTVALDAPVNKEYKSLQDIAVLIPNFTRKLRRGKIVAVLMSNCAVKARNEFLAKLRKHIEIDVYGACSDKEVYKMSCPGHFKSDCDPIAEYLFYLVLENTSCFQYLTEKVFYHAYSKGAIPVIFGPKIEDIEGLLPPNSYLHADSKTNVETLAKNINALAANAELLLSMHMWRNHYKIVNEHGYFGTKSYHLCRVCEALNYNDEKEKIYDKGLLDFFLDPSRVCY